MTRTQQKPATEVEKSAIRKISIRLVPFVALMFFINFLDRTAISFAGPNGMMQDLGLQVAQFGGLRDFLYWLHSSGSSQQPGVAPLRRAPLAGAYYGFWGIVSLLFTG